MNAYPPELLVQLAPVMFVAGLDTIPPSQGTPESVSKANDFALLTTRLRDALQAQRKVSIWQPEKSKCFQVIIVDKDVRFPPRKLGSSDDSQSSASHSPLSPLTPTSPLYPDGLIAPIWIRKHSTLVPSVFVLFLRIYEFPPSDTQPLGTTDGNHEREKEQEEKRRDMELAAEVALRKKSTNERGTKLTVVLIASRKMLDDPTLDARLTHIRRQSGLDSRAALFVLSPVNPAELNEFVKSLQQALYEPALEYYTAHSKRVRRKRNRHSQAVSYPHPAPGTPNISRPLRPEGWTVRYEYKMACFAEFRGEDEVALKHYQDAHSMLVVMFGSTAILPPRTKRWAEAKVLADCINVKIFKLYLYNNEHALALSHHNTHTRIFSDFSRGWGIGEETFEYWSWIARQHRVLAELLELGTMSTLILPVHKPVSPATLVKTVPQVQANNARGVIGTPHALEVESTRLLGINPSHALQHPGFYYYMAARCTEIRRERFLTALEIEHSQKSAISSPGFANEKKVDHLTIILELYTKAYEAFKNYTIASLQSTTQSRLTLWIAYRIAQTYYDSEKYDMAIRFFERIAKTYRREKWGLLLRPLLSTWYACAQKLEDVELSVKILVETLGQDFEGLEHSHSTEKDLMVVLKTYAPTSADPIVVDLSESQPIFDSSVIFWTPEIQVGELAPFQLSLIAPINISISSIPFSSLLIYFSHKDHPLIIKHQDPQDPSSFRRVDLGHISPSETPQEILANLRWQPGSSITFSGTVSSEVPISLEVSKLVLTITEGSWNIEIPYNPRSSHWGTSLTARWLSSVDPPRYIPIKQEESSLVSVRDRPHNLTVSLNHYSPAYLNENYPITINIANADDRELDVFIDVLLPPTEIDGVVNTIILGDERSSNFIKGVAFGTLFPGATVTKTLYLMNAGAAGERTVDISIQSRTTKLETRTDSSEFHDATETLRTLVIPAVDPIRVTQTVAYVHSQRNWPGLADLRTFDDDFWDDSKTKEALVHTKLEYVGPWSLEIEHMGLDRQDHESAKVIECSADDSAHTYPSEYQPGDELTHICHISLAPEGLDEEIIASPGKYSINWRRIGNNGERGPIFTTVISLPLLKPPVEGLIALLSVPPAATLHKPISLTITIRNQHPTRLANIAVQLEPDASDSFVVAGLRSGRIPTLMPGTEERLTWRLIPIECGYVKVPRIKVIDRRPVITNGAESHTESEAKGELVKIIDVRGQQGDLEPATVLVLP